MMVEASAVNLISLNKKWYETDSYKDVREIDILEDKKGEDPTRRIQKNDLMRLVTKGLNRNERLIIILYYYEELTMKEIGATLDLSESRVSQMHSSIVARLQGQLLRRRPEFGDLSDSNVAWRRRVCYCGFVKSFQLYLPKPDPVPTRVVKDFKAAELAVFREAFRPLAATHRWHIRLFFFGAAGFVACLSLGVCLKLPELCFIPALVFHVLGMSALLTMPLLECPACNGNVEHLARYCPECGSGKFECRSDSTPTCCPSCMKVLRRRKSRRSYKVHFCTHCGIRLDDLGV